MQLKIQPVAVAKLRQHPRNPRVISAAELEALKTSMVQEEVMLQVRPVLALPDGTVFAGNQRLAAALELGWEKIPCAYVDIDEERALEWMLRDNNSYGSQVDAGVAEILKQLQDAGRDLTLTGFGTEDLDALLRLTRGDRTSRRDANRVEIPTSERGQLYELGEHRLLCGDTTSREDVAQLMAGDRARLLFTSPPYADLRDYGGELNLSVEHLATFIDAWDDHVDVMAINLGLITRKAEIVTYWDAYLEAGRRVGRKLLAWNVWDRGYAPNVSQNTSGVCPIEHEWVFVLGRERLKQRRVTPTKTSQGLKRTAAREVDGGVVYRNGRVHKFKAFGSVLHQPPETAPFGDFPAAFPPELAEAYVLALTEPGDLVVDSFGGSGTTLVACDAIMRPCRLMEIDPAYCDVIRDRHASLEPVAA